MPIEGGDPLTGPRYVAMHGCGGIRARLGSSPADEEGDAAAGLLLLGDMRLMPLLEEVWQRLSPEGRRRMVKRRSNLASSLMVEFLLRRLEEDEDGAYHGELGAALHHLPETAAQQPVEAVLDLRRNFGLPQGKEPMELLSQEDMGTVFIRIRPRLEALIDRESEPRVLPGVLAKWASSAGVMEASADDHADVDEEDEEEEDEYPDVSSQLLHDEFEDFGKDDGFVEASEDIYFWGNPYKTKPLNLQQLSKEFDNGPIFPLLVTGIFNPLGPTLNIYLVQPDEHLDGRWRLSLFTLNPFSCTKANLGMLDGSRVKIEPGRLDHAASTATNAIVMEGRNVAGLQSSVDFVMRFVLGKSKLLPSFTLCHVLPVQSHEKTLELVAVVYQATASGRGDLEDLRDPKKRLDPWARADMGEAMRKALSKAGDQPQKRLSKAEASEMAKWAMDPEQQRIEMLNLLQAWEGAIDFNQSLRPVLGQDMLLQILTLLCPDLPGLLKLKPEKSVKPPSLSGLPEKIYFIGYAEVLVATAFAIWALFVSAWFVAIAMPLFLAVHLLKLGMMHDRRAAARWVGLFNYVATWGLAVVATSTFQGISYFSGIMELKMLVGYWCFGMAIMHLLAFDFARQMREAPDEE
jgi:hypothetical protein